MSLTTLIDKKIIIFFNVSLLLFWIVDKVASQLPFISSMLFVGSIIFIWIAVFEYEMLKEDDRRRRRQKQNTNSHIGTDAFI